MQKLNGVSFCSYNTGKNRKEYTMASVCSTFTDIGFDAEMFRTAVVAGIKSGKIIPPDKPPRGQVICKICFDTFIRDTKAQVTCKKCRNKQKNDKAKSRSKNMGNTAQGNKMLVVSGKARGRMGK